ncbi:MAG TPA: hypothetical protein VFF36_02100, partial [Planctomycetota bacterium]|nr:hypothetical protein [Planctomycetota bacterium]
MTSALSSNMLFGGAVGGGLGLAGGLLERGLLRAKGAVDARLAAPVAEQLAPDLGALDVRGLKAARQAELDAIAEKRIPERQAFVEDLEQSSRASDREKLWEVTTGHENKYVREIGPASYRADQSVRRALDNRAGLTARPQRVLDALQTQGQALDELSSAVKDTVGALQRKFEAGPETIRAEILAGKVKGEVGPFNAQGLDYAVEREMVRRFGSAERLVLPQPIQRAIEHLPEARARNMNLQERLGSLLAEPASHRLTQIDTAIEAMSAPHVKSIGETVLHAIPFAGRVAELASAGGKALGGLRAAAGKAAQRGGEAASSFLGKAAAAAPHVPVAATKVLMSTRYAPSSQPEAAPGAGAATKLATAYKARTDEIKSQTAYDA